VTESGTAELATIPGLEMVEPPHPSGERVHWLERGPSGKLMLFSGRSNLELAERIAEHLNIELGDVELNTFANGETYCRFRESIRGADVFIVQSGSPPVNDHLVELLIMINAARLASANRITAVLPWYPYSRHDKKSAPREPITAKLVADMLQAAGVDRVLTMDLHAGQIQGFFRIPVDHMTALPMFAQYFRDKALFGPGVVAVSPDPGRAKMANKFGQMLEAAAPAYLNKTRPEHDVAVMTEVIGDVRGKVAIMTDDIIVTGGTLIAGAKALKLQPMEYDPSDPAVERLVYEAVKLRMPVLFHHTDLPKTFPAMLTHFASTFTDGNFVVIHFGGIYGFREVLPLASLPNVFLETSTAFQRIVNSPLKDDLTFFQQDRLNKLIFGTEHPLDYELVTAAINTLAGEKAAPDVIAAIFRGNAEKLLGLV